MKIALGTDHAGYDFKEAVQVFLKEAGHEVQDLGTYSKESCDYPDYADRVCKYVVQGSVRFGILVCGAGIGMSIAANKVHGIRAALCHDFYTAQMGREHNDANVLVLPARIIALPYAQEIIKIFLKTEFAGGRHAVRVDKIMKMEC
jgi:ribose 5-phosphate isomerase B